MACVFHIQNNLSPVQNEKASHRQSTPAPSPRHSHGLVPDGASSLLLYAGVVLYRLGNLASSWKPQVIRLPLFGLYVVE